MDKDTASIWNFRYGLKEKVKSETFEYLATEYGSLKSMFLIFNDRDLTSDGERKGLHLSHDSVNS